MERHGADFWQERIKEQQRGGMTVAEYCRKRGYSRYTFMRWSRRLEAGGPTRGFVEIRPSAAQATVRDEVAGIVVILANGSRIQFPDGVEPQTIGSVVAAVRSAT